MNAPFCVLRPEESITLSTGGIRVSDVLTCDDKQWSDVDELAIASLPEGVDQVSLSRDAVADLVRRRVPGLAGLEAQDGERVVTFHRAADTPNAQQAHCFAAARSFAAGELVTAGGVMETACIPDQRGARLAYDRQQRVVRTAGEVAEGDYLGRLMPLSSSDWDQDQTLTLKIQVGPVTIEREVRATEPGLTEGLVFVRDSDGIVFRAPVDMLAKKEGSHD